MRREKVGFIFQGFNLVPVMTAFENVEFPLFLAGMATLAAWLKSRDALPGRDGRYVVSQGREVGYAARLQLRVDDAGDVWSGGHVRTIVTGQIDW